MAFPQVATIGQSIEGANTSTHDAVMPTGISSGDLLLMFRNSDDAETISDITGWTELATITNAAQHTARLDWRVADGTETDTTWTTGTNEQSVTVILRITGWHGTAAPEIATASGAQGTSFDPASVTASWGSADNLFLVLKGGDGSIAATNYPTNYADNQTFVSAGSGSAGSHCTIATRELALASDDPGTFTDSDNDDWGVFTVVVRPAAAGGGGLSIPVAMDSYRRRRTA